MMPLISCLVTMLYIEDEPDTDDELMPNQNSQGMIDNDLHINVSLLHELVLLQELNRFIDLILKNWLSCPLVEVQ